MEERSSKRPIITIVALCLLLLLGGGAFFVFGDGAAGSFDDDSAVADAFGADDGNNPFAGESDEDQLSAAEREARRRERERLREERLANQRAAREAATNASREADADADATESSASATKGAQSDEAVAQDELPENAGTLKVFVTEEGSGKPLSGVQVFAPVPDEPVQMRFGEVLVQPSWEGTRKLTNEEGVAFFDAEHFKPFLEGSENREPMTGRARIVVSNYNYVPLDEIFSVGGLREGGREIEFKLVPAVRVEGRVSPRKGGGLIPDAKVEIQRAVSADGTMRGAYTVTTDSQGKFTATVARDYIYRFEVTAKGYVKRQTETFDFRRDQREVRVLLDKGRSLGGVVMGPDGPVEGATITNETDEISTTSDQDGSFLFTEIGDQIWTNRLSLRVTAEGYSPARVEALVNDTEVQIELKPEAKVIGYVTNAGQGVSGASVNVSLQQGRESYTLPAVSCDEVGGFEITGLGEGRVTLTATAPGGLYSAPTSFNLKAGEQKDAVELKLAKGAILRGSVTTTTLAGDSGVGLGDVPIAVDGEVVTRTNFDGTYRVDGIAEGKHQVSIPKSENLPAVLQDLQLFNLGERYFTLPKAQQITAALGQEVQANFAVAEFEQETEKTIQVAIDLDSAESLTGLKLRFTPAVSNAPNGAPAEDVERNVDLVGGKHEFELVLLKGVSYSGAISHTRIHDKEIKQSEIDAVQDGGQLLIRLEAAYAVTGYVKDSGGNPLAQTWIRLERAGVEPVQTDQHGFFELGGLKQGEFTLVAFRYSYYEYREELAIESFESDPKQIVLLGANEIRIHVFDTAGQPAPNARVRIWRPSTDDPDSTLQQFNLGETDAKGTKLVNFHGIRHYQIVAYKNGQIGFVNFPNEVDKNVREFDLYLEPSGEISGQVVNAQSDARVQDVDIYLRLEGQGSPRDGNRFYARTDVNGFFRVRVPVGSFTMVVRESRAYQASETAGVTSGSSDQFFYVEPKEQVKGNWAERVSLNAPSTVTAGESFTVSVGFRNRGSTTWTPGERFRCGSEKKRDNKTWGTSRLSMSEGGMIPPGGVASFSAEVKAPSKAGTYTMTWRMVQDGKEWFGEFSQTITITVQAASE